MGEGLAEVDYQVLNVGVAVKSQSVWFFLFGDALAVDAITHDVVKVFDGNTAKIHDFDNFDFELRGIGGGPCLDHSVHKFTWVLIE